MPPLRAVPFALGVLLVAVHARAVETVMVPAEDGTLLATDIYRKDEEPRPVLVFRGSAARSVVAMAGTGTNAETSGVYDVVAQDIRGTGDSEGTNYIFRDDGSDGRALLTYIKTKAWSNGHVSMAGASNAGIVDYLAAPGADPSLRGINPSYATGDLLHYGVFNGGVLHRETADLVGGFDGMPWEDYASLPIWPNYLIDDVQAASIDAIGLHRGGWFDVFGQGTLDSFSRMQYAGGPHANGHQKVVIGPWTHGGGPSETVGELTFPSSSLADSPYPALNQAWQTGVFTGDWSAWDALPPVHVYLMGDADDPAAPGNVWKTYETWPPPAVQVPLYLTAERSFATTPGGSAELSFTSDPSHPSPTVGGTNNLTSCLPDAGTCGPYDQRALVESRKDVLVFTSAPTDVAGAIVGRIHADVWIATDLPDVDVFVRLTDVYPDGRSMLMAQGIQRARYRNGTCPQLLAPGEPALIRVDMSSTALALAVGHKLRVIVSAAADPLYAINPQNGDDYIGGEPSQVGSVSVLVGGDTASAIVVPVAGGSQPAPDERPVTEACEAGAGGASTGGTDSTEVGVGGHGACACRVGTAARGASGERLLLLIILTMASCCVRRRSSRH